jgi:hypothetical protein
MGRLRNQTARPQGAVVLYFGGAAAENVVHGT